MKAKITKKDGTVIEIEGTADEIQKALDEQKATPQTKKRQILTDDIRRIVAEELAKQPHYCQHYPWWTWTIQNPTYPANPQPNILQPGITFTTNATQQRDYETSGYIQPVNPELPASNGSIFLTGMTKVDSKA
jgi:hypothetical protein